MRENRQPTRDAQTPRGWYGRGYLPHFDGGCDLPQSVTFRLADSVPTAVIEQWICELKHQPSAEGEAEVRKRIEKFIDTGYGACHLRDPRIGLLVESALLYFDSVRYQLHAWVVMPNHVHTLFTLRTGWALSEIVGSWKSFTSKEANRILNRSGQFWMEDYFDRYIRNAEHYDNAIDYIENNPVKAGLCRNPEEWAFGSAGFRKMGRELRAAETAAVPGVET